MVKLKNIKPDTTYTVIKGNGTFPKGHHLWVGSDSENIINSIEGMGFIEKNELSERELNAEVEETIGWKVVTGGGYSRCYREE